MVTIEISHFMTSLRVLESDDRSFQSRSNRLPSSTLPNRRGLLQSLSLLRNDVRRRAQVVVVVSFALFAVAQHPLQAQTIGPCKIFPQNNPWNQRVDNLPVHWNSQKYINSVGGMIHLHPDFGSDPGYGIPWEAVSGSQPFVPIDITAYPDESDPGPMPIPSDARVEQPAPPGGDGHVLIVDTGNCMLYELYQGIKTSNGWSASSTAIFDLSANKFRPDGWTSCDAAGLPIFPGLVKMYECQQGEIKHAIRFTVPKSQAGWIFPARHKASSIADTTYMPMGLRLRLKANYDDSHFTGYAKVISTAMKRYGIIMADNGSSWFISGETNTNWPDNDISQLKAITGNDFEAVYTGPVATYANEYPTPTFTQLTGPAVVIDTSFTQKFVFDGQVNIVNTGSDIAADRVYFSVGKVFSLSNDDQQNNFPTGDKGIWYSFSSQTEGTFYDTLRIINSKSNVNLAIPFVGVAKPGSLTVDSAQIRFPSVPQDSAFRLTIMVGNGGPGTMPLIRDGVYATGESFSAQLKANSNLNLLSPQERDSLVIVFAPKAAGPQEGTLHLLYYDWSGQRDTTFRLSGVGLPLASVAISQIASAIKLVPNPATSILEIDMPSSQQIEVAILDAKGSLVLHQKLHEGTNQVNVGDLSSGYYFASLYLNGEQIIKRFEVLH